MRLKYLKLKRRYLAWRLKRHMARMSRAVWILDKRTPRLCKCPYTFGLRLEIDREVLHYCPNCLGDLSSRLNDPVQSPEKSPGV